MFKLKNSKNNLFQNYSTFEIDCLEKNSGITFGNMLRRILLNNIRSIGITEISCFAKNRNIDELNTLPEFQELVIEFSENIKNLVFMEENKQKKEEIDKVILNITKEKRFTAKDLKIPSKIKIINSNHYLGTNTIFENIQFQISLGYNEKPYKKESMDKEKNSIVIKNNTTFNPVLRVNYKVEKIINLNTINERLIIEIWTNGCISPKDALIKAVNIGSETLQSIKHNLNNI
jgi:DNA-directed RNA polymerase subunit alpha